MNPAKPSMVLIQDIVLIALAAMIAGIVFIMDLNSESTVAVASMYAIVILYSWLLPGKFASIYAAGVCSFLTFISAVQTGDLVANPSGLHAMNWIISLVVIWTCVTLVFIAKSSYSSLEEINRQLTDSHATLLEKIKELDVQQQELSEHKTKLESLNADLLVKNRELERFTSIASHDLQEPLRTIGNMTQLLAKKYYGNLDGQGKKILDYVASATTRMTVLIKGLLEFSRIGTKRNIHAVDLQELLNTIVMDLDATLKTANATVIFDALPTVEGNPVELRMLFQNLVGNAIKFRKIGIPPLIEVTARDLKTHLEFCVKDNGIGIDAADFNKIFLIFQRLNPVEKFEGLGLGLAYCRKIVELHGGKIWINSNKGVGSSFYFTLTKLHDSED